MLNNPGIPGPDDKNMEVKQRELLYRLMISQLFYDGHQQLAVNLASSVKAHPACPPSDRLLKVLKMGLKVEEEMTGEKTFKNEYVTPGAGIDLEFETDERVQNLQRCFQSCLWIFYGKLDGKNFFVVIPTVQTISPEAALYETCYVTAHKGPCRVGVFHPSGQLIATGSEDTSIKILDVERMLSKSATPPEVIAMETPQQQMENHPVIRTLYDHNGEVSCLDFHPQHQILASGSKDHSVRFFEYSKPSVKKAYKSIQEAAEVRTLSFHPSGDFLLVGTQHPTLRLYDVKTFSCFVGRNPNDQHSASVTCAKYSPNANLYTTCSKDGHIKIWDGVSSLCINTFKNAHDGEEVCSVQFTRNSKYILSCGKDSLVKLWELSTNRCLIVYTGAGTMGKQEHRTKATLNHTEDYVLFPDEKTTSLCCWDSRNAERQRLLSLGHNGICRCINHSPVGPAFVTCSDDNRARFWYRKADSD